MVFNHKAYEELYPRKEKQPKHKAPVKKSEMGNVLEEAEQEPEDQEQEDLDVSDPDDEGGGDQDGNE